MTSAKQRVVLAALALRAGRVVSVDELVDCLWGEDSPATARETVHSHVMRLRKTLPSTERARLVTRPPGYMLEVAPEDVDVHRVRNLRKLAATAAEAGDAARVADLLTRAHDLAQGDLLADVDSQLLHRRHAPAWEEFWTQLTESRIDAEMALGRHAEMLDELRSLVDARPLAEHFRGQLMLALSATGQVAEALREYQRGRRALIDGLGVEPGPHLQSVHREILAGTGPAAARQAPPAELPHAIRGFVGRQAELTALDALTAAGIVVLHGMGGVGKTTTAIHWAHHNRSGFPDGQLYLNLRGFDTNEKPLQPAEALPRLLHSLGIPPGSLPSTVDEQASRLRSLLADKRTLMLLDNAADPDQVRPLLPGGRRCLVIVTSRNLLSGLIARDHAVPVRLEPFSPGESADLLASYLGQTRLRDDPASAASLARYCGHLPLALSIIAARALEEPSLPLAELDAELRTGDGLDAFEIAGGTGENLRAVFSWSYRALPPATARLFRLLALHPGHTVSPPSAAALAGVPAPRAAAMLSELTRTNLLERHSAGRYRCHDLLRVYATELAATESPESLLARRRVLDWYLHTTVATEQWLRPHRPPFELVDPATEVTPMSFSGNQDAMRWCEAEKANLVAAVDDAAAHGLHEHAWQLALALSSFCYVSKQRRDWITTSEVGLRSARALGGRQAEGAMLSSLGSAYGASRRYDEAIAHFRQALDLHRATGDHGREPATLNSLAVAYAESHQYEQALAAFSEARELHRSGHNAIGEAVTLMNIALANTSLGRAASATSANREALAVFQRHGDRYNAALCLANLGETYALQDDHNRAVARYRRAIEHHMLAGNDYGRARTLTNLGRSLRSLGEEEQARECWQQALVVFKRLGDPNVEEMKALLAGPNVL